jgi:hypothetical protein
MVWQVAGRTFPVQEYFLEDVLELTGSTIDPDGRYALRRNYNQKSAKLKVSSSGGNSRTVNVEWDDRDTGAYQDSSEDEAYAGYPTHVGASMGPTHTSSGRCNCAKSSLLCSDRGREPHQLRTHRRRTYNDRQRLRGRRRTSVLARIARNSDFG